MTPQQGEVWWAESEGDRRPVLVVTRSEAVPVLTRVLVAPVTRTVRGIPTEIVLGEQHGLDVHCAASFDNLVPMHRGLLTDRLGGLAPEETPLICEALEALADC